MYSGTVKKSDLEFAELQKKVPDLKREELQAGCHSFTTLPTTAPWMSWVALDFINITGIRRNAEGKIEFQLADEKCVPCHNGTMWRTGDKFPDEWPD